MTPWQETSIDSEARRYCDRYGVTDAESFQRVKLSLQAVEYEREIAPYLKVLCRVEALRMIDQIVIPNDGGMPRVEYKPFPPETEAAIAQVKEAIRESARRWGLVPVQ